MFTRLAAFALAALLVGLFWIGLRFLGAGLARALRLEVSDRPIAATALGLLAYYLFAVLLGFGGILHWQVLAAAALIPGLARLLLAARDAPRKVTEIGDKFRSLWRNRALLSWAVAGLLVIYLIGSLMPAIHYDLMVNYLAVPKLYLINGNIDPIPYNVFSALALFLHVIFAYLLALSELVDPGPFLFGGAAAYSVFILAMLVACLRECVLLGRLASAAAGRGPLMAGLVWLAMPQTLLLAVLKYPDFFTTYLVLLLVRLLVGSAPLRTGDGVVAGVLSGLLVAAKIHFAVFVAVAAVCLLVRLIRSRAVGPACGFAVALLGTVGIGQLRSFLAFGHPLFPFAGAANPAGQEARTLLTENAIAFDFSLVSLAEHLGRFFTLQPETGLGFVFALFVLAGKVRNPWLLAFAVVPVIAINAISGSTYNALRWVQPSLVVLLVVAAANWSAMARAGPFLRWLGGGLVAVSAVMMVGLSGYLVFGHLGMDEDQYLAGTLVSYQARRNLIARPGQVLYVGELEGFYGAENGIIPTIINGRHLERYFGVDSIAEIRDRLQRDDIRWLSVNRANVGKMRDENYWSWCDQEQAALFGRFLATLEVVERYPKLTVYRVGP